jgi:hypothetical protein
MARPRKPLILHKLEGTVRKDRHQKRESELRLDAAPLGDAPEWIDAEGKAEWKRLTEDPTYSQVLSPVHRGALIEYCVLYSRMVRESQMLGPLTASERQTLNSLRMQFGITPASQSKVQMPQTPKALSKWAETAS